MTASKIINQSGFSIFFPVIDPFLNLDLPQLKNLYILKNQKDKHKNSSSLLNDSLTISHINKICQQTNTKAAIMPFKPSSKIEFICRQNNWSLISNPRKLNIALEDKISFAKLCQKHKLKTLPFYIDKLSPDNIRKYQRKLKSSQLIIQTKTGWAGNSTFLVKEANSLPLPTETLVKITPFRQGQTIILNGCIYKNKLILSPPALQLNNPKHSSNMFATTGRSWPAKLDRKTLKQIKKIAKKTKKMLKKLNYQGFLGLDFLVDNTKTVYLLEINPRLTASFNFYTHLEQKNNYIPLLYFHISQFLHLNLNANFKKELARFSSKQISGTQISIRNPQGKIYKQIIENV